MKATEQCFPVVLFILLHKVFFTKTLESLAEILNHDSLVVLFIMLYKVVLSFKSVDEILKCDHSNESY